MNEESFKQQLISCHMKVRDAIVPTSAQILLYGHTEKIRIVHPTHEELIYACIKSLEDPSDELYQKLTQTLGYTDLQVLEYLQNIYEAYLKDIRKAIIGVQKDWSKNFCQYRANQVIEKLRYTDIVPICDLVNERLVPIELILKVVFDIDSQYGDHRRKKDKTEVYIDPRVLKYITDKKTRDTEYASRTVIHQKTPAT